MDIAKRLTEVRETQGLSKTQLAKISGVSQSFISYIEAGKRQPTLDVIERLCKALGITVSQFLQESDDTHLPPDLFQLLENAKKLPPAERKALNEYLKIRLESLEKTPADLTKYKAKRSIVKATKVIRIPLLGASAAGNPMTAIGYYEGFFEIPEKWGDFAVRVNGDSMEPLIPDKGYAFIRQQEEVNSGEIALVKTAGDYEDEVTIKKVRFLNGQVQLLSENQAYKPMTYDLCKVKILGKVNKWLSAEEASKYFKEHV